MRVGLDLLAVFAPESHLVRHLRLQLQAVEHDRDDRLHPRIGGAREVSGPAALGGADHHKLLDLLLPVLFGERLERVHRLHRALRHRLQQRPGVIPGLEVLRTGIRNQDVFGLTAEQRLVRDVIEDRHRRLRGARHQCRKLRLLTPRVAAGDQQQRRPGILHLHRTVDAEGMVPRDSPPHLRAQAKIDHLHRTGDEREHCRLERLFIASHREYRSVVRRISRIVEQPDTWRRADLGGKAVDDRGA